MITGTGVHDRPESAFTIEWNECSRSTGIGVHDPPERATEDLSLRAQVQKMATGLSMSPEPWLVAREYAARRVAPSQSLPFMRQSPVDFAVALF
jgi:hypothetical protein